MSNAKVIAIIIITTVMEFAAMTTVVVLRNSAEDHKIENMEAA